LSSERQESKQCTNSFTCALDCIQYAVGFEQNIFWTNVTGSNKKTMLANKDNPCSSLHVQLTVRIHLTIQ